MHSVRRLVTLFVWGFSTLHAGCSRNAAGTDAGFSDASDTSPDSPAGDAPPPPVRHLGIEVDQPAGFDHGAQIDRATAFGVDAIQLTFPWVTFEPDGTGFKDEVLGFFEAGMTLYRNRSLHVVLSVPIIDTVATLVPSDLAGKRLDSPEVIARAEAAIAALLARSGSELAYLVLSNEVDIHLAQGAPTWAELDALTGALAAKVHQLRPDVRTGISVTAGSLARVPANPDVLAALAGHDVAFVTYYQAGNFGSASSAGIAADLATIVAATDRPIVLKELGYPTGPALNGSETGQAAFITAAFAAWDANAARVPLVMFSRMFDGLRSDCEAQAASYGLPGNEAFIEFLCTLGLRTYSDGEKPGWSSFMAAAQLRSFGR